MKKEWTEIETKSVEKTIRDWFLTRETSALRYGTIKFIRRPKELDEILGLAYTSSGKFAGLWICNDEVYLDNDRVYHIRGFVLDDYDKVFAYCMDKDENELFVQIGWI